MTLHEGNEVLAIHKDYLTLAARWSASVIKVSGQMRSNSFSLQLLLLKNFITEALEYKAVLKFKNNYCMCCYAFYVISPCSYDFLLMSLYIYIIKVVNYYSSLSYECLVFR